MKKIQTTYQLTDDTLLTVNEEFTDHVSVHGYGDPCSGILKHWATRKSIIKELQTIIAALEKSDIMLPSKRMTKTFS